MASCIFLIKFLVIKTKHISRLDPDSLEMLDQYPDPQHWLFHILLISP
jgi:hypothetical protein